MKQVKERSMQKEGKITSFRLERKRKLQMFFLIYILRMSLTTRNPMQEKGRLRTNIPIKKKIETHRI